MKLVGLQGVIRPILASPTLIREIGRSVGDELGAGAARSRKSSAAPVEVTPTGKWVHIVERPNNGALLREMRKKIRIVDKPSDPMEVEYVADRKLIQHMGAMLTAVVTEIGCIRSASGALKSCAPKEQTILRVEHPHKESVRRVKLHDSGIVGFFLQDVQSGINSFTEKRLMQPVRGTSGTAASVHGRDVRDSQERVASM
jgi:hypothetical protein